MKCNDTSAETRFRLSAKRTGPFKSAGASVQSTTGNRGVRISRSNAGYTMFRGSVKNTGYPLHSPVSPSLPLPYVTVCHHISTGLYLMRTHSLDRHQIGWFGRDSFVPHINHFSAKGKILTNKYKIIFPKYSTEQNFILFHHFVGL